MSPFGRDGHLHDLGLELLLAGEIDDETRGDVDHHLARCPACTARVSAVRTHDAHAPPVRVRAANRGVWVVAAVALVAVVLAMIRVPPPSDLTPKGGLLLEVFADRGDTAERLLWGDRAHPGDRLGFRARTPADGALLVVGVDGTGAIYPCFPTDGQATAIGGSAAPQDLPAAVRLDDTPGAERIVAVWCPSAFGIEDLGSSLIGGDQRLPEVRAGCLQDEVRLIKEVR